MHRLRQYNLVYLASPFSKYKHGQQQAFIHVAEVAARLLQEKVGVYSPIVHTYPLSLYGQINPLDHNIWLPFDERIMKVCDVLCIAKLEGWDTSYGVGEEIKFFRAASKEIYTLDPVTLKVELYNAD